MRRTVRVPGLGLYDTKVIGQPATRRPTETPSNTAPLTPADTDLLPESEWYPEGRHAPLQRRRKWPWVIGGLIVIWILATIGSCNSRQTDNHSSSGTVSTAARTVTVGSEPTTVTVPPTTVTVVAEAPPPAPPATVTVTQDAPPLGIYGPPAAQAPAPLNSSSAYYKNCSEARVAGAAPLRRGEPGYRDGLDRDGDGVACE
jgi:hypothetical protein